MSEGKSDFHAELSKIDLILLDRLWVFAEKHANEKRKDQYEKNGSYHCP